MSANVNSVETEESFGDPWNLPNMGYGDDEISAYTKFFCENKQLFKNKIVLDVGFRSGLLGFLANIFGASRIFATGNIGAVEYYANAMKLMRMSNRIQPLEGCITKIELPDGITQVDVIVSEWMGNALFADSLLNQLMFARNKWLAPGGHIVPNIARLHIVGLSNDSLRFQSSATQNSIAFDDYVKRDSVVTNKFVLRSLDLRDTRDIEVSFKTYFKLRATRRNNLNAGLLYCDIGCTDVNGVEKKLFCTGPQFPKTYLKQTILALPEEDSLPLDRMDRIKGRFTMTLSKYSPRGLEFSLCIWPHDSQRNK